MNPLPRHLSVATAIGVICAAMLLWIWQERGVDDPGGQIRPEYSSDRSRPAAVPPAPAQTTSADPLTAHARALLDTLEQTLRRGDVRPGEAILSFNDEDAYRRFLGRAHRAGLSIVAQADALWSVRVRFENRRALEHEVGENAADYSAAAANGLVTIPLPPAREDRAAVDQVPFRNGALGFLGATSTEGWGRGTTIAILDTGVAADATLDTRLRHLEIGLGTLPGAGPNDGHGTAVAALAAGSARDAPGVAPAADVLSIRVTDANGVSDLFTVSQAIVAAVDAGARIINLSLGGYSTSAALDRALAYASNRGALVVAAAGNDQAAQLAWPAADPRVLSVGAVDAAEQQVVFSNSGDQLQITAPGYGVQTAWLDGQRVHVNGTSASAPLVAGAIAAVMSRHPALTPLQAAQVITDTASDAGLPGTDPDFGHGILNLGWAMHRNDPAYVDTAISSHQYDAADRAILITVQNRGGRTVTGMSLNVAAGTPPVNRILPSLAPGEIHVVRVPTNASMVQRSGDVTISTTLANPAGVTDQVPANNARTSVFTPAPAPDP